MKQLTLLLLSVICISSYVYPQVNGSFFTLQLGKQTCLFKYEEKSDTISADVDSMHCTKVTTIINAATLKSTSRFTRDSVVLKKTLRLQEGNSRSIRTKMAVAIDTTYIINTVTLEADVKIISHNAPSYHIETEMSYFDFLLLLKSKFEIKNPQKRLHVSSFDIYYETSDTSGIISVKYPQTTEGVVSKLNCLANGGFILLSLKSDDHNLVNIDAGGSWLALIHIKK